MDRLQVRRIEDPLLEQRLVRRCGGNVLLQVPLFNLLSAPPVMSGGSEPPSGASRVASLIDPSKFRHSARTASDVSLPPTLPPDDAHGKSENCRTC